MTRKEFDKVQPGDILFSLDKEGRINPIFIQTKQWPNFITVDNNHYCHLLCITKHKAIVKLKMKEFLYPIILDQCETRNSNKIKN